ncbi:MAG: universal stress protein [Myxococcota bacterium]|nr:universal stress protein [Myxococcota bacterium]
MYQTVLVPLDLTIDHERVFETALGLVSPDGRLLLLHVIEAIPGLGADESEEFYQPLRTRAEELVRGWAKDLGARHPAVEWTVRTGKRGPEVLRFAAEEGCDLIITTSRRPDPNRPGWGIGTTSPQITLMAPCSVLVVR